MAGKGRGTPLFELLSDTRRPAATEHDPAPVMQEATEPRPGRRSVPLAVVYVLIAAGLAAATVAYVLGYQAGHEAAMRETDRSPPAPTDERGSASSGDIPGRGLPSGASGNGTSRIRTETGRRSDGGARPQDPTAGSAEPRVLGPVGPLERDPRERGLNYLQLATLPAEDAVAALAVLAEAGIRGVAVRVEGGGVDRRGRGANNPSPYRVFATELAVPGERYSAMERERREFERRVAAVGRRWLAAGGSSDFTKVGWVKFDD